LHSEMSHLARRCACHARSPGTPKQGKGGGAKAGLLTEPKNICIAN
jgi:hypothetical protein